VDDTRPLLNHRIGAIGLSEALCSLPGGWFDPEIAFHIREPWYANPSSDYYKIVYVHIQRPISGLFFFLMKKIIQVP